MSPDQEDTTPVVPSALLKPYASVVVLMCVETDPNVAFMQLSKFLDSARRINRSRTGVTLVGLGFDKSDVSLASSSDLEFDETIVTVHRIERKPGWLKESAYVDTSHELTIAIRKSRLVAICAVGPVRDALQKWLDKPLCHTFAGYQPQFLKTRCFEVNPRVSGFEERIRGATPRPTARPSSDQTYEQPSRLSMTPPSP
jgi:hypothetical protein